MLLLDIPLANADTEDFSQWSKKAARRMRCPYPGDWIGASHSGNTLGKREEKAQELNPELSQSFQHSPQLGADQLLAAKEGMQGMSFIVALGKPAVAGGACPEQGDLEICCQEMLSFLHGSGCSASLPFQTS